VTGPSAGQPAGTTWRRLEEIFAEAIELPEEGRGAFLERACAGDAELRARLVALLEAHEALLAGGASQDGFLESLDGRAAALLHGLEGEPEEGDLVGRYRIVRPLGQGGMGRVYLARDPALDRPVALKLLPPYLSGDPAANRRLVEEARAASALDHPHIATVYEIGEADDGRLFIAMAYYEGATLRERLREGPLPVAEAAAIAAAVAEGLAAAHARGIVHRDVKPENVILAPRGVRIVDFGVAKVAANALTRTGATSGTVAYMSPEQTSGGMVDHRTDLWALGVVLHEMLAGERPFRGDAHDAVIYGIRNDEAPPLARLRPEVPPALSAVVERCLAKDPARRPASASELAGALRAAAGSPEEGAGRARGWLPLAAYGGAAALTLLGTAQAASRFLLPGWIPGAVLALLLVLGLVTLRTRGAARQRSLAAGAAALAVLVAAGSLVVAQGLPRVTDARGVAGGAFGERGWVLVADFEAGEGGEEVGLAAREALMVDLQQSGFLNVVPRAQIAGILQRMGLPDTVRLAGPLALEVAERAGAGAVLSASVSRLGPQYVLSGRALSPASGDELFAVRTAAGADRLLGAVESLSREMRRRLGERRDDIRRSRPLPEVSTASLAALRLYALAERLIPLDYDGAGGLAGEALRSDSTFAMGHRLAAAIAHSQLRYGDANHHVTRAFELRDRLPERERWHIEALYHATVSLEPRRAAEAYELLLQRYPDDWRAANNLAGVHQGWLDNHEAGYTWYLRASQLNPQSGGPLIGALKGAHFTRRAAQVDSLEKVMEQRGLDDFLAVWRAAHAFAEGEFGRAAELCDALLAAASQARFGENREFCGSLDVASGRLRQGVARLEAVERFYLEGGRYRNLAHVAQAAAMAELLRGDRDAAAAHLERVLALVPAEAVPEPDRFINRTSLQVQAALLGRPDLLERIGAAYPAYPDPWHWFGRTGDGLVSGARAVAAGDGQTALRALRAGWPSDREAMGWRIWNDLLQGMAFDQVGQPDSAAARFRSAADARYHTVDVLTKNRILLPFALQRIAAAEEAAGNPVGAAEAHARLLDLWAGADPELQGQVQATRSALTRLAGGR
jgi:tetratricopeptide (TPR) repeat protein